MNAGSPFQYDRRKAIEAILYISKKIRNPDIFGVCKLLYLADKTSLETYGRFIFGDAYSAMEKGPVPSNAYDLMKEARNTNAHGFKVVDEYKIIPNRSPNLKRLSESDVECLKKIIILYGNVPNWLRRDVSHDEAWKAAWNIRGNKSSVPINLESIIDMFDDADDLKDYVLNRDT
jgi:uncharacterized phage-associated protein